MRTLLNKVFHATLAAYFYLWNAFLYGPAYAQGDQGSVQVQVAMPAAAPDAAKVAALDVASMPIAPTAPQAAAPAVLDAQALPQRPVAQSGQIVITQPSPGMMHIQQGSQNAHIDWDSFNIGQQAHVRFNQPSSSAIAINKVVGQDMSQIYGKLSANGRVFLINPNGILMGKDSVVDVNSLLLSTNDLSPQAMQKGFETGQFTFALPEASKGASIVNEGAITVAEAGLTAFVAPHMRASGHIQGRLSNVVMASGEVVTVDLYGDKLINLAVVEKPIDVGNAPKNDDALIEQRGTIVTDGGGVLLTAQAARGIVDNTINNSGVINASSARVEGGKIILDGGQEGKVVANNVLDVSSKANKGGTVKVLANAVEVNNAIKAEGPLGGGEILIGGNYQGKGPEYNAKTTKVGQDAHLFANGSDQGDGGKVIVWSDHIAHFRGSIDASGKKGGFAEISGKEAQYRGEYIFEPTKINLMARDGKNHGTLLLDPHNITVADGGGDGAGSYELFATNPPGNVSVSPATLNAVGGAVALQANTDITITNAIVLATVGAAFTARAGRSIVLNNPITTNDANITLSANDAGALLANRDASAGNLTLNNHAISAGAGSLTLALGTLGAIGSITGTGNLTAASLTVTSSGAVSIGSAATDVKILNTSASVGAFSFTNQGGNLDVAGAVTTNGGGPLTLNVGILRRLRLNAGAGTLTAADQNITLTADTLTLNGQAINAGTGNITIQPSTVGRGVEIEAPAGGNAIRVRDADLAAITSTGWVTLGNASAGIVTVGEPLDFGPNGNALSYGLALHGASIALDANDITLPAGKSLTLTSSAGDIVGAGALTTSGLTVTAVGAVSLTGANNVATLSGSSSVGAFSLTNTGGPLAVTGSVNSNNNNMTLNTGANPLTVNAGLNAGTATVALTGGAISGNGGIAAAILTANGTAVELANAAIDNLGASQATAGNFKLKTTKALTIAGLAQAARKVFISVNDGNSPVTINAQPRAPNGVFIEASNLEGDQSGYIAIPPELNFDALVGLTDGQQRELLVDGGYQFFTSGPLVEAKFIPGVIPVEVGSSEDMPAFAPLIETENTYFYKKLVRIEDLKALRSH